MHILPPSFVDSPDKISHFRSKIVCMDSHFPGQLFAVRPDKGIAGDDQSDAACSQITVTGGKLCCGTPVCFAHAFPGRGPDKPVGECHAIDCCFFEQSFMCCPFVVMGLQFFALFQSVS